MAKGKLLVEASDFKVIIDDKEVGDRLGRKLEMPPVNFIFLIDTSPSADAQLKTVQGFRHRIVEKLEPNDKVMVVGFNQELNLYQANVRSD